MKQYLRAGPSVKRQSLPGVNTHATSVELHQPLVNLHKPTPEVHWALVKLHRWTVDVHQTSGGFRGTSGKIPPEAVETRERRGKVREH